MPDPIDERLRNLKAKYRTQNNLDYIPAVVGDNAGNVFDTAIPGNIFVRVKSSNGLSAVRSVKPPTNSAISLAPGTNVELEYNKQGLLHIAIIDIAQSTAAQGNPLTAIQPATPANAPQAKFGTLLVIPTQPTPNLSVTIKAWNPLVGGTVYQFGGATVDLTASVPSTGDMCYAMLAIENDYLTVRMVTSTPRLSSDVPLGLADLQECVNGLSGGDTAVFAVKLIGDQTQITQSNLDSDGVDMRQLVNNQQSSGSVSGPGTTTDRAVPSWNGTTGSALRDNPNATIDSSGNLTANAYKLPDSTELTEASDAVTITQGFHTIKAESGTADNLATINGGSGVMDVTLRAKSGHTITVKTGTGNIYLNGGSDFAMSGNKTLRLFFNGSNWADTSADGTGGGGSLTVEDGSTTVTSVSVIKFTSGAVVTDAGGGEADVAVSGGGGSATPSTCEGRLTLSTGTPVTTSDVTAATTLYFAPYKGNQIGTYSGSAWSVNSFSEKSLDISAFTANKNYDIFIVDSTLALEGLIWTDDVTRATALVLQDGIYVKSGATTRRYLGTIRITGSTGQCEDSFLRRFVWNYYNRCRRAFRRLESTSSWSYSGNWRAMNNSASNRIEFVRGLNEDALKVVAVTVATASADFGGGIGLDSTSSPATVTGMYGGNSTASANATSTYYEDYPALGYHYLQQLEKAASGSVTFYGNAGVDYMQSGLSGDSWG